MAQFKSRTSLPSREEQIASLMEQLRPKVGETLRRLLERAIDVAEA